MLASEEPQCKYLPPTTDLHKIDNYKLDSRRYFLPAIPKMSTILVNIAIAL